MLKYFLFTFSILFFIACIHEQEKKSLSTFTPKVLEVKGYIVPKDSITEPLIIPINEKYLTKVKAGKPTILEFNTNNNFKREPEVILAGDPRICTPGQDSILLPIKIIAKDSSFVGGMPEVIVAKDASVKDQNPQNFCSFSKLQGLKHDVIRCILQDRNGNLWFGTHGGGVSKYDGKSFTHYTEKEGLSNNSVWSILEDRHGILWFGTYGGGVTKFDGKSFTHFTKKEGLNNNRVRSIIEDKNGNLWFGTYGGGVSKFDGKSFTNYTEKEGLLNNYVFSIFEDNSGNIWFGTDGGICKFNGNRVEAIEEALKRGETITQRDQQDFKKINGKFVKSFFYYTKKEGLCNNSVWSILEDFKGNLWFGTYGGGVSKFDGKYFTNFTEEEGLCNNRVWSIIEDKSGNIWFGTDGGITKYDWEYFTNFTEKEGLSNGSIFSILEDKSGNLWFGTYGGGVSKYNGKLFTNYTEKEGLSNSRVLSILEDKKGDMWFGTSSGGVSKFDGKSFTNYTEKEGLSNNSIRSILEDKIGNLWFGTVSGGVTKFDGEFFTHYTEKDGLSNNSIWSIIQDHTGNIWFATTNGVSKFDGKSFTRYTINEGLSNNSVYAIFEDHIYNIWFGTYSGGLTKYDGKHFTHYTEKEGLSSNSIRSILEDKNGTLWFGSDGGGVSKYDGKTFTNFTEKEGLSNNYVFSLLEDKNRTLWFGTRFGFCKLTAKSFSKLIKKIEHKNSENLTGDLFFKSYGYDEGFLGIGVSGGNTICEDKTGNIWIGANDRLTLYHPEGDNPDTIPPNIKLTGIELFNEPVEWVNLEHKKDTIIILGNGVSVGNFYFDRITRWYGYPENLSLAYNNNYLTFNFIGITQSQSKKVKYQFKLEGIDDNWSAITSRTDAPYGNLPNGTYTFKIKAMNSEGYWSNEFNYTFTIRPPWWKTWWFRTLLVLSGILLLISYIKWRERKLKQDKELLERKVKEQTHELSEKNEELNQQKEEIETQRDEILAQRDLVTIQKDHIVEIHKEVTDSINYAKRIQEALLPVNFETNSLLSEYFILFKPKNIVSGDFYFMNKKNNLIIIAVADCTGHGVPGAFMSMLGISFLNEIIRNQEFTRANIVLNQLRNNVINALQQRGTLGEQKDGMDISLFVINTETNECQWAGANNPLYLVSSHQSSVSSFLTANCQLLTVDCVLPTGDCRLFELKGDKMPIAIYPKMKEFRNHEFILNKGDSVYLFTDGYADQFGGEKGKKFKSAQLKELLSKINSNSMLEQKLILEEAIENWKGDSEQIDDITILGVKI